MSKIIIYGAGLIIIAFVIGLLLFLTFDNILSGQAIYGTRHGSYYVSGTPSILLNIGILGLIASVFSFLAYLFKRKNYLKNAYFILSIVSFILIAVSLLWAKA